MPLSSGETFAGYRIVRLLGSGAMGEVYLAEHPRLPRRDALKVLRADVSADPDYRARFNREADLASKLWHPHIVSVHDRGEYDDQLWISMDYVDGLDAARLLATRYPAGMPADHVVRIVTAVASALDYAHKQGLLHRDVKPANIMLTHLDDDDDEQRILLADFGIARNVDDISGLTATNMTVGTVAYSAPEQLMGEEIDGRADQYALAATAYHLLTGSQLFPHSNPAVVISRHLNSPPPALADTRPELAPLDLVLAAALAKDPEDRFARCAEFARAFAKQQAAMSGGGSTAPTVQAPARGKPPASRTVWRPLTAIAAVVAVILIGAAALIWHPWQPQQSPKTSSATPISSVPSSQQRTMIAPPTASATPHIAGMAVYLDPGHNAVNNSAITQQVPNGRGGTTQCDTSGTATDDGYPEHAFTWDVVGRIQGALNQLGVRTQLSRDNDNSAGPCVDQRAALANAMRPDAIVSIQADGGPSSGRGFHVNYSSPPLNDAQAGPALQLAHMMRDALVAAGYQPSTYIGSDGLYGRDDLAGLNLAQYPAVLVELGNMKNADEAAQMESADGRAKYAAAVTQGIVTYLSSSLAPPPPTATSPTTTTAQAGSGPTLREPCRDLDKLAYDRNAGENLGLIVCGSDGSGPTAKLIWFEAPLVNSTQIAGAPCPGVTQGTFSRSTDDYLLFCTSSDNGRAYLPGGRTVTIGAVPVWQLYRP